MSNYLYHNKGIYGANGKPFHSKLEAILEANRSSTYVSWDYHDAVFSQHQWHIEPTPSLDQLYRERALQLRDAYDHLVLFYSGGVDSWNILNTFVTNQIHLDEIYIWGAFEAEQDAFDKIGWSQEPGYYTREVQQTLPLVKQMVEHLGTKVNIYDWTRDMLAAANDLDWIWRAGTRFDPTCMVRSRFHKVFREHNDMLHRGKRVGFVYGVDKPRLLRDDHDIYFAFLDVIMTTGTLPTNDILNEYWENDEYFYWSPNMPELCIKQSHVVVNWLQAQNKVHLIKHINNLAAFHDELYYQEVNRSIYPHWNHSTWQIKKPTGAIYNEQAKWFLDGDFAARLKWESSLWELERICGPKWFNNNSVKEGLRGHLSPMYRISTYSK